MSFAGEAMPSFGVIACLMNLQHLTTIPRSRSGSEVSVELGRPYFMFNVQTTPLSEDHFDEWMAWVDRRDGGSVTFTAYPIPRGTPRGVIDNPDSSVSIAAVNAVTSTVQFTNVGNALAAVGDMFSYATAGGGYYLGRCIEQATASGGAYTVKLRPAPQTPGTPADLRRTNPIGEFRFLKDTFSPDQAVETRTLSFSARQVIR